MRIQALWADVPPYYKLVLFMILVFASAFVFTLAGSFLVQIFYGINIISDPGLLSNLKDTNVIAALKLLQVFSAVGTFIVPSLLGAWLINGNTWSFLGLNRIPAGRSMLAVAGMVLVSIPLINWLMIWNEQLALPGFLSELESWMKTSEANAAALTEAFLTMPAASDLIINLVMIGLIPAIGEELLFRGMLQPLIKGVVKNAILAILITSILFSAMHLQFYGFLPRMVLGLLLGFLMEWSRSLWLPVLMHFLNNGAAVCMAYFYPDLNMEHMGTAPEEVWLLLVSVILTGILLVVIYRHRARRLESDKFPA